MGATAGKESRACEAVKLRDGPSSFWLLGISWRLGVEEATLGLCLGKRDLGTRDPDFCLGTILLPYSDFALIPSHPLHTRLLLLLFLIKFDVCWCLCFTYIYYYVVRLKINTSTGIYLVRQYSKMVNSLGSGAKNSDSTIY